MSKAEPYTMEPHSFDTNIRAGGKQYCTGCGLVSLNNDFTAWAVRMGCNYKDHPSLENKRSAYTQLF